MRTNSQPLPTAARRLQGFAEYRKRPTIVPADLKLDSNEGASPDPRILQATLQDLNSWNCYPSASRLEAELARRHGVDPEQVLITAGADEALDRICRAYLESGRKALCHWPSFEMLPRYTALAGGEFCKVEWSSGSFPLEQFQAAIDQDTTLLFLVSPNNPTGLGVNPALVEELAASAGNSLLVLDQAYAEFDSTDLTPAILAAPNGILLRSFSKAWGLAGIRVGYAIADKSIIDNLRKAGSPYSVSVTSIAIARACLENGKSWLERSVPRVQFERQELRRDLLEQGFEAEESKGNFVLARGKRAKWLHQGLAAMSISVRAFPSEPQLRDSLRITCPCSEGKFIRLRQAISTCLQPEGLLFDMDGVLADVSGSYRLAIQATARSWGLELSMQAISSAKAEAGSNNDWLLTQRILERAGKHLSLSEVTARFESFYQGGDGRPGLRENEVLAVSCETLARLAKRYPLSIVTGRPRVDAERFLAEQDIGQYFQAVLCMEDGPPKPDPAILHKAMQATGVQSAWMLGDFPDDITAARAASVLPIGVVPPGSDPQLSRDRLIASGAACVLSATDELENLLQ